MNGRVEMYKSLGFSDDEIHKMSRTFNAALSISARKIEESYNNLLSQGLTKTQIKNLIVHTPSILGMEHC